MPPVAEFAESVNVASPKTSGMSAIGSAASWKLIPRNKLHPGQSASPVSTRPSLEESGLHWTLKNVIGTTTSSSNAFDANPENNSFVCCAGPAVILSQVDDHCDISQRLFRARESALAVNSTPSFYNPSTPPTIPSRSRQGSPLKDRSYGPGSSALHENEPHSPAYGRVNTRSRETTCVSLSPGGQLLAVGEVNKLLYTGLSSLIDIYRQDTTRESFFSLQRLMPPQIFLCPSLLITALVWLAFDFLMTLDGFVQWEIATTLSY